MTRRLLLIAFVVLLAGAAVAADPGVEADSAVVATIRGLSFKYPVVEQSMTRSAFRFFLKRQLERGADLPIDRLFGVLGALQLIPPKTSVESILDLYEGQVLAFYDPATHKFFKVTPPPADLPLSTDLAQLVTVHELTHALQDQRFDAGTKLEAMKSNWDAQMAYQSVLEGEATLVMFAAMYRSAGRDLDEVLESDEIVSGLSEMAATNAGIDPGAPPYFVESMKFPYVEGVSFVIEAYRRGGWKELDFVHQHPPSSTAQILDPASYFAATGAALLAGAPAVKVSDAKSANPVRGALLTTTLGRFHWEFLLGEGRAAGWVSDRASVAQQKNSYLVTIDSSWATRPDAARFAASYSGFLRGRGLKPSVHATGTAVHVEYSAPASPAGRR